MAVARLSGRVRRVPGRGVVVMSWSRDGTVRRSGRGAADVQVGGCGAGGDTAGGVRERLPAFDLVVAVVMSVGADPGGGDHGQGVVVGGGPGGFGDGGGGGPGPHGGDQGATGGGERQMPGRDGLPGAEALLEGCGDGGGAAGGGVDEFGGDDPRGVLLADQLRGGGAQDRPGPRAGAVDGRFGLPQGGFGAVPPPPVGPGRVDAPGGWCGRADR